MSEQISVTTGQGTVFTCTYDGGVVISDPDRGRSHTMTGGLFPGGAVNALVRELHAARAEVAQTESVVHDRDHRIGILESKLDLVDSAQVSGIRDLAKRVSAIEAELEKASDALETVVGAAPASSAGPSVPRVPDGPTLWFCPGASSECEIRRECTNKCGLRYAKVATVLKTMSDAAGRAIANREEARDFARDRELMLAGEIDELHAYLTECGDQKVHGDSLKMRIARLLDRQHREMERLESERDRVVGDLQKLERELHETQAKLAVTLKERDAAQDKLAHHTAPTTAYPAVDDAEVGPPSAAMSLEQVIERYYGPDLLNGLAALLQRLAKRTG